MPSRPPGSTTQLLNRLRMRQVALILAIDEARTLRGAAESLGMTQSAASQMLHELEETLGEPLFVRVGRGLQLNPAGQVVPPSRETSTEPTGGSAGRPVAVHLMYSIPPGCRMIGSDMGNS